jgi:hypothetical protein
MVQMSGARAARRPKVLTEDRATGGSAHDRRSHLVQVTWARGADAMSKRIRQWFHREFGSRRQCSCGCGRRRMVTVITVAGSIIETICRLVEVISAHL